MECIDVEIYKLEKKGMNINNGIINFNSCKNYLGTFKDKTINIFELTESLNMHLKNSIDTGINISNIDFNPRYKNILLSIPTFHCLELCKISELNNYEVISILKGANSKGAKYAKFNPVDENKIISSKDDIIDIWDVTRYINIMNTKANGIVNELKWDNFGHYYGYIDGSKCLKIYSLENKNIASINTNNFMGFEFRNNENDIISFHDDKTIKIWDKRNYSVPRLEIKELSNYRKLYDKKNDFIYVGNNNFHIQGLNHINKIYEQNIKFNENAKILLDPYLLKDNVLANLIEPEDNGDFNIIQIKNKNKSIEENKYIENIVYKISDHTEFSDYINSKKDPDYINKNYIGIKEIEEELEIIQNETLPNRKILVVEQLNKNQKFKNIVEEYIYYIKLILRDNTNKKLLEKYLKFLKKNESELKKAFPNLDDFQTEVEFYKVFFNKDDYYKNFQLQKKKSEKEELIDFLTQFNNCSDIQQFRKLISTIKTMNEYSYFNQPITGENEELMFFASKLNLFNGIAHIDYSNLRGEETFKLQVRIIDEVLKGNYFDNVNIINNNLKVNLLISLILYPDLDDDENNKYNLNLLISGDNSENDINEIIENLQIYGKIGLLSKLNLTNDDCRYICKNNFFEYLNNSLKVITKKSDLYIYDKLLEEKEKEIDLVKIKSFLKDILKKPMFKKILELLYKKEDLKVIQDNSFIDDYIDNHLFLIPYKGNGYCGLTDRFSSNSYIFFDENISSKKYLNDNFIYALKTSRFIIITFHEFNHYIYTYILRLNNFKNLSFDSPRNKDLIINESGLLMELILFGKEINDISLEEAIFLLDDENYDKSHILFQKDFNNIKNKELKINGSYYSSLNIDIANKKDFGSERSIVIKAKMKNEDNLRIHEKRRKHCVL